MTAWHPTPKNGRSFAPVFRIEHMERRTLLTAVVVNTVVDAIFPPATGIASLRDAVATANGSSTPTTITFDPTVFATPQTITLIQGNLVLNEATTITGPAAGVTISGAGQVGVFNTNVSGSVGVNLSGLTITDSNGSGIYNTGTLTLANATVSDSSGTAVPGKTYGGGIYNGGTAILNNVTISGNSVSSTGHAQGGGIDSSNGTTTILTNCTVSGNSASGTESAVGGGIYVGGDLTLTNSTIFGNTTQVPNLPPNDYGGGIESQGQFTTTIVNSIIAGNESDNGPDAYGSFNSLGFNLIGEIDSWSIGWNIDDLTGTAPLPLNPMLAPLGNYGGPTQTMPPLPGSPAIDAGSNTLALDANYQPLTTDQRGMPRIVNGTVDIGAVEYNRLVIDGTTRNDTITLTKDANGTDMDWTLGASSGVLAIHNPNGLTVNGNGGNTNGNPLPAMLHLNGTFTINGLQGTNPLAGTTLEIGKSTVFITYSSFDPIAAIQGYLRAGYNAGGWNGTPTAATGVITSAAAQANANHTTGIGYADWADGQGINTTPNTIELTYTLYGDANLDHQVNSADLQILLFSLNRPGSWDQGDFNYDAQVNSADLQNLLFTLNTSLGSQATPLAIAATPAVTTPPSADSSSNDPSPHLVPAFHPTGTAGPAVHHPHAAKVGVRKRL
jgi:hypothetical protein